MIDQALQELIDFVKSTAPLIWEALTKQVYNNAVTNIIWGVILIFGGVFLIIMAGKWKKKAEDSPYDESNYEIGATMSYVFGPFAVLGGLALWTTALRLFVNPTYYAIMYIIQMFEK